MKVHQPSPSPQRVTREFPCTCTRIARHPIPTFRGRLTNLLLKVDGVTTSSRVLGGLSNLLLKVLSNLLLKVDRVTTSSRVLGGFEVVEAHAELAQDGVAKVLELAWFRV